MAKQFLKRAFIGFAMVPLFAQPSVSSEKVTMILATTPSSNERVQLIDGKINEQHPGWFIVLSRKVSQQCGASVEFAFMPWARALHSVEFGQIAAAFNSSYKAERAVYSAYPMKNNKPDESRANKRYIYSAYVAQSSTDTALLNTAELKGRKVAVERGASIIALVKKQGGIIHEATDYDAMLQMLLTNRVDVTIGIEDNYDPILRSSKKLSTLIKKIDKPIKKSIGYVMFSKIFYANNKDLVECFWTKSADLKKTDWFKVLEKSYQ